MKRRRFLRSLLGIGLLLVAFSVTLSAPPYGNANIRGTVSRSGRPLRSVWVLLSRSGIEKGRSLTGDDGQYFIGSLDVGGYEIVVKSGASEVYHGSINLPANQNYDIPLR